MSGASSPAAQGCASDVVRRPGALAVRCRVIRTARSLTRGDAAMALAATAPVAAPDWLRGAA